MLNLGLDISPDWLTIKDKLKNSAQIGLLTKQLLPPQWPRRLLR